jgi:hypothetical protein
MLIVRALGNPLGCVMMSSILRRWGALLVPDTTLTSCRP